VTRPSISPALARVAGLRGRLAEGLPVLAVAALAAVVLVGILYTVATAGEPGPRAYAEVTLSRFGCSLDTGHQAHATGCIRVSPGVYRVSFSTNIARSTVVASRGSCCTGAIGASIDSKSSVVVAVARRVASPIRASIVIP
jgi:hypothetical protein